MRLLSIGETAAQLGVAVGTLRRWHRQGLLSPSCRTMGGHRRYQHDTVQAAGDAAPAVAGKTVCYTRVSSHDQAESAKDTGLAVAGALCRSRLRRYRDHFGPGQRSELSQKGTAAVAGGNPSWTRRAACAGDERPAVALW